MATSSKTRKRKFLTLAQSVKVIDLAAKGKISHAIALSLDFGQKKIQGIFAKKTLIIQSRKAGMNSKIQYLTMTKNKNFVVTGPILQEKARERSGSKDQCLFWW